MSYIVIVGGPSTGKGTRAKILCEKLEIPHVSTGVLLRAYGEDNPDVKEQLANGFHISDELTTELLYNRLIQEDCAKGCVIDGYPRNINQAHLLNSMLSKIGQTLTKAIELTVPDEVVFNRILGRKECSKCGKPYGFGMNPKVENVCDNCHGTLVRRSDDTEETLKTRINLYKTKAQPILDYYQDNGLLVTIDASDDPHRILRVVNC